MYNSLYDDPDHGKKLAKYRDRRRNLEYAAMQAARRAGRRVTREQLSQHSLNDLHRILRAANAAIEARRESTG
jgi:hypothetical protein